MSKKNTTGVADDYRVRSRPAKGQLHLGRHLHSWYDGRAEPITVAAQLRTQGLGNAPAQLPAPMVHSTNPSRPSLDPLLLGALVDSIRTRAARRCNSDQRLAQRHFPLKQGRLVARVQPDLRRS